MRKVLNKGMGDLISKYDENTKEMNDEIVKIFDKVQSDTEFKTAFIYESLSGKTMLGDSSDGRADSILTWSADFKTIKNHDVKTVADKIVSNFSIPKFGSKSSGVRITKTIQMFYQETDKQMDNLVKQEAKLIERKNSKLITEGAFTDLWNTLQEKGASVVKKIIDAIMKFIQLATAKISESITSLLSFLGFEVQILEDYSLDASINYESV